MLAPKPAPPSRGLARLRLALGSLASGMLGLAPHVLHHVGPLAGAALLAGSTGRALFGGLGLLVAVPGLLLMRRRTGSWRRPVAALALFATLFSLSSFLVVPALTGAQPSEVRPTTPPAPTPAEPEHGGHHR